MCAYIVISPTPILITEYDNTATVAVSANLVIAAQLATGTIVSVICHSADAVLLPPSFSLTRDGVGASTGVITARAAPDRVQLRNRVGTVECTLSATGHEVETITLMLDIGGAAQPSYLLVCNVLNSDDLLSNMLDSCSATLTTRGNETFLLIGGECDACPQPAFGARTSVSIGGVAVATAIVPGSNGQRVTARSPSIEELIAKHGGGVDDFQSQYFALNISSGSGAQGIVGESIAMGDDAPVALTAEGSLELACASIGWCPNVSPPVSGVYYTDICGLP